jgi:hypothetical protein
MSDSPEDKAMATMKKAQQMVEDVKRQLEDGEDFFRKSGLNRAKVTSFCAQSLSADDKRKADELLAKDMAEVEDEVQQARLHQDDSAGGAKAKRPRSMV